MGHDRNRLIKIFERLQRFVLSSWKTPVTVLSQTVAKMAQTPDKTSDKTPDSKNKLHNSTTATSTVPEGIVSIEALKEVDEEVQYAIAQHQSSLNPTSKQSFLLYLILLVAFLNATSSGFDGSLMGSINAETQYKNFFHLKETGSSTGLVFILYNAASTIGCAFG